MKKNRDRRFAPSSKIFESRVEVTRALCHVMIFKSESNVEVIFLWPLLKQLPHLV